MNNNKLIEDEIDILPVPQNCEFDINLGRAVFKWRNATEGVILGALLGGIIFILSIKLGSGGLRQWAYVAVGVVAGFIVGNKGVRDETISMYVLNALTFFKRRRTTFYNPRIKREMKFFIDENKEDDYVIPRERIESLYYKYINKRDVENAHNNLQDSEFNKEYMYFEDDIDYLGKPLELMSKRELKKLERIKKKEERRREKENARELKEKTNQRKIFAIFNTRKKK